MSRHSPLLLLLLAFHHEARADHYVALRWLDAPEATQAVAVDSACLFAIGNRTIAQYDKLSGERRRVWEASDSLPLLHLNSGVVLDGKLVCAHSNFPHYPETSSVEVWDAQTLEHRESHSLGIGPGSLTWIDRHDGRWWAVFAHYTEQVNDDPHAREARWTELVCFDDAWRRTSGWVFPPEVVARFEPHSCSGGAWDARGRLYCTGHDRGELYELTLPRAGAQLRLERVVDAPITGQGIAWDPDRPGVLYGIDRGRRQVVVAAAADADAASVELRAAPTHSLRQGANR